MKIGIVIPTYFRKDNRSKQFLDRCLKSIKAQTHTEYKVFLIGDKYEYHDEFEQIASSIIDSERIYYENREIAEEREKYGSEPEKLWASGGVGATNYGIEKALSEGYEYICHIDHDDYWVPRHLEKISNFIDNNPGYVFICSYCLYLNKYTVPTRRMGACDYYPEVGDVVHSSTCVKFSDIGLRYRDCFSETSEVKAADADLWQRMRGHMISNNLKGRLLDGISVYLDKVERS